MMRLAALCALVGLIAPGRAAVARERTPAPDPSPSRATEAAPATTTTTVRIRRVRPSARPVPHRRLRADLGLAVGISHNLGDLVAPHLGLELGLEYRLAPGLVGVRLFSGYGWASQQVPGPSLEAAQSSVSLVAVGGGVSYRAPLPHLTPYVMWGCLAQSVRTTTRAPYLAPQRARTDVAFGVTGVAGASRQLGPGRLFLQLGYRWSEVDNEDVRALVGGLVLEGGYRLEL